MVASFELGKFSFDMRSATARSVCMFKHNGHSKQQDKTWLPTEWDNIDVRGLREDERELSSDISQR